MEAENVLNLFDSYWFELEFFKANTLSNPSENQNPILKIHGEVEKPKESPIPTLQVRSLSDRFSGFGQISFSSNVPSSIEENSSPYVKTTIIENPLKRNKKSITRRKRSSSCKSLGELEEQELKGFTDLGIVFSEIDKDSDLVLVVPGLNRFGGKGIDEVIDEHGISRPYLSEAWENINRKRVNKKFVIREIQSLYDGGKMKDHIRAWAQTVASTLRY